MILDVDLGNTRIKWRSSEQPGVLNVFALDDELPAQWRALSSRDRLRLASVLKPEKTSAFIDSVRRLDGGVVIECARVQQDFAGLRVAYNDVSRFGVDRWLALLAIRARLSARDCVVVSGGTALTVDLLRADGRHLGGYIAPGRQAAAKSLWQNTDGLSDARQDLAPRSEPGTTTLECVAAGLTLLFRGLAHELQQRMAAELFQPQWVFTGGDAEVLLHLFTKNCGDEQISAQVVPELVLEGLAIALP